MTHYSLPVFFYRQRAMRPELVQKDRGTENGISAGFQCNLTGMKMLTVYFSSHVNQRFGNRWSQGNRRNGFLAGIYFTRAGRKNAAHRFLSLFSCKSES